VTETPETPLIERILAKLDEAGKDLEHLTEHDLAPLDQFHNGGTWATRKLMNLAEIPAGSHMLDVGGAIGGPARTLTREFGVRVTVLDRSADFCHAGAVLTGMIGTTNPVRFLCGDALALPLADASIDAILLQNATMNIADRELLAAELFRVLRPDGRLALQEVTSGPVDPVRYPTPWAVDASESFLLSSDDARTAFTGAGFEVVTWLDASELIQSWVKARIGSSPGKPPLPPMTAFTMPEECDAAIANMWRNEEEHRTLTIWAVLEKPEGESA